MVLIAFAWDDGSDEDLKLMDLSLKFNIPAIFFIPAKNTERPVISEKEVKIISKNGFEIGAHTYSHKYLPELTPEEAEKEMINGKDYLEQILGKKAEHFCFPGGRYNNKLVRIAQQYFGSARTADTGALIGNDSFLIRPALHFYDRGILSLLFNSAKNKSLICPVILKNIFENQYFELLKKIIIELNTLNGLHRMIIWGHSWEIEKNSLWQELDSFFEWLEKNLSTNLRSYSGIIKYDHNIHI